MNERELRFHYPPHQDEYNSVFPPNVTVITGGVSQEQKRPKMLQILGLCGIGRRAAVTESGEPNSRAQTCDPATPELQEAVSLFRNLQRESQRIARVLSKKRTRAVPQFENAICHGLAGRQLLLSGLRV